jgi:hypothetical protein
MSRWTIQFSLCASAFLLWSGTSRAANESLGRADLTGKIKAVYKVQENIEKDPTVGFITVGKTSIRVTHNTSISMGPSDLVYRGFGSLKKGQTVEVAFIDATAEDKTAKEINILKEPAADKERDKADKVRTEKTDVGRMLLDAVMARNSLNVEGIYSKIVEVKKVAENGDTVGTIEFPAFPIRVTKKTVITEGAVSGITRGFDDLKKGATVEVVQEDPNSPDHTAKQINILIRPELEEAVLKSLPPNKDPKAPELSVHVVGWITSAKAAEGEVIGVIHIEGPKTIFMDVGSADVAATAKTKIVREDGKEGRFADLAKGRAVAVVVTRAEAEAGDSATRAKLIFLVDAPRADKDEAEKADIRGLITNVSPSDDDVKKKGFLGRVRVEGAKEKTTNYDKALVLITNKTKILKQDGKERKEAKFEDLKKGSKVQIDFTGGPVAESYPIQATAETAVILEEPK